MIIEKIAGLAGYRAISSSGAVVGVGDTVEDAIEEALRTRWAEYVQKSRDCAD